MDQLFFYFFLLLSITMLMQALLQLAFRHQLIMEKRVADYVGTTEVKMKKKAKRSSDKLFLIKRLDSVIHKMKAAIERRLSLESTNELERKLRDAGVSYSWTPIDFRLLQLLIGAILFMAAFLLFSKTAENNLSLFLLSGALGGLGYYYPLFYLGSRKKRRAALIEKKMADFFDMVNLSVEAGLGLDAAIVRVCKNTNGPLSEEFTRAIEEMKLGKSRREAFINLRNRIPLDAFQSMMTSLIQADQLGIGMAKVLRALTVRVREHQRQSAREKAMKAPVKMIFPMLFFIFPSIFIVLLGPLVIYLIQFGL
ncbi:type II secretion system F family protein [Thalassobacillus devorans]|uniref:type II secretion system F family protein n=1 Tax=Thalassobacillus devorans TaxID=279813 RepID=UPI0004B3EF47|nr:type II secretion system F family protein [Thalassobacillus devorans]